MTEIMLPIRPKWCELIASGKKTIEARKFCPKCDVPFKVYIYCTMGDKLWVATEQFRVNSGENIARIINAKDVGGCYLGNGKVIGEFVCYDCFPIHVLTDIQFPIDRGLWSPFSERIWRDACFTPEEVIDYAGDREYIFGWTISDLIIYDKPKQLSEFYVKCDEGCEDCYLWQFIRVNADEFDMDCMSEYYGHIPLKRPPQNFCYVERTW